MATRRQSTAYLTDGNTALQARTRYDEDHRRIAAVAQKRRAKARSKAMNLLYLTFLTLSLAAGAIVLTYYIMLHSQITGATSRITALEKQLSAITKENDETYNQISGNIDLEEVRRIAIQEYGMQYVEEGQIVTYSDGGGSDYVRQKAEIPDVGQ